MGAVLTRRPGPSPGRPSPWGKKRLHAEKSRIRVGVRIAGNGADAEKCVHRYDGGRISPEEWQVGEWRQCEQSIRAGKQSPVEAECIFRFDGQKGGSQSAHKESRGDYSQVRLGTTGRKGPIPCPEFQTIAHRGKHVSNCNRRLSICERKPQQCIFFEPLPLRSLHRAKKVVFRRYNILHRGHGETSPATVQAQSTVRERTEDGPPR